MELQYHHLLKRSYSETPTEGPEAKRVKFIDIHETLKQNFPSKEISTQLCGRLVEDAFPGTKRIRTGKKRISFVVGIEKIQSPMEKVTVEKLQEENTQLRTKVHELEERLRELDVNATSACPLLVQQMDSLLQHGDQIIHGPSTPVRFPTFSLKGIAEEIQRNAPDLLQLFNHLGDTGRNTTPGTGTPVEQRKAIMSLCTLMNARSRTANGLQLLLTFMLIARATSKQVRGFVYTCYGHTCNIIMPTLSIYRL